MSQKVDDLVNEIESYINAYTLGRGKKHERITLTKEQYDLLVKFFPNETNSAVTFYGIEVVSK